MSVCLPLSLLPLSLSLFFPEPPSFLHSLPLSLLAATPSKPRTISQSTKSAKQNKPEHPGSHLGTSLATHDDTENPPLPMPHRPTTLTPSPAETIGRPRPRPRQGILVRPHLITCVSPPTTSPHDTILHSSCTIHTSLEACIVSAAPREPTAISLFSNY